MSDPEKVTGGLNSLGAKDIFLLFRDHLEPITSYVIKTFGHDRLEKILAASDLKVIGPVTISNQGFDFTDSTFKVNFGEISADLIKSDFGGLYSALYTEIKTHLGPKVALELFYGVFIQVKDKYDYVPVSAFLDIMPEEIKSRERLSILSRKELEDQVFERTKELEEEKSKVERKVEERTRELQAEKNKLETVTENMLEGVILIDSFLRPIFVNKDGRRIMGISDSMIDKAVEIFDRYFTINSSKYLSGELSVSRSISLEKEIDNLIYEISFRRVSPVRDGENECYLIWIKNITQFKLLERDKSEFVSVAAHQLRTPLSGIKWTLAMFIKGDLGLLTPDQKAFIMKTYESNERMIILVNDLLNVEHISSQGAEYSLQPTDGFDLIENILVDLSSDIKNKNITIKLDRGSVPAVPMDAEKMRLVFQNLLENAVKYTMKGGSIIVSAKKEDHFVTVCVADTGIGIPVSQQPNIFKRFYRASNATRIHTDGSGLGLFLVRTIVEHHGGKVWFESVEGQGTSFFVSLPLRAI